MSTFIEPLLITGALIYAGRRFIFGDVTLEGFSKSFIKFCESKGISVKSVYKDILIECSHTLDKGLLKQKRRNKTNHLDKYITGASYKHELNEITRVFLNIKRKAEQKNSKYGKMIDSKITEFNRRVTPLILTLASKGVDDYDDDD